MHLDSMHLGDAGRAASSRRVAGSQWRAGRCRVAHQRRGIRIRPVEVRRPGRHVAALTNPVMLA
jgi:hypothetical protein